MRNGRQDRNSDLQPLPPFPEHFISVGSVWNGFHVAQIRDAGFSLDSIGLGRVEIPNVVWSQRLLT
jgi:hypothetical protein